MDIDWTATGYPAAHYRSIRITRNKSLSFIALIATLLLLLFLGSLYKVVPEVATAVVAGLFIANIVRFIRDMYRVRRYVKVCLCLEDDHAASRFNTASSLIARTTNQLDSVAAKCGVRTISSYGFLAYPEEAWNDPIEGLITLEAILAQLKLENVPDAIRGPLNQDILKWIHALEVAREENQEFAFMVLHHK